MDQEPPDHGAEGTGRESGEHVMTVPAKTRKQWAAEIIAAHKQSVEGILKMGRSLIAAKKALIAGTFLSMIEHDLPFDASTAQRLMKIANDPRIRKAAQRAVLPGMWGTLYELTKLPDAEFKRAVSSGAINPRMTRDDAKTLKVPFQVTHHEVEYRVPVYENKEEKPPTILKPAYEKTEEKPLTIVRPVYVDKELGARIELLTTTMDRLTRFTADDPAWCRGVIDYVGKEEFHEIIVMLQAVYDAYCKTERKVTGGIEEDTADDQADDAKPRLN
jgi:hypothetical protein